MLRIKKDDKVVLIAGKDKGKTGKVIKVFISEGTAVVENLNIVKKAVKKSDEYPNGGFIELEKPVHLSNLMLVDPKDNKPVRSRVKVLKDGKKLRVSARSGETI